MGCPVCEGGAFFWTIRKIFVLLQRVSTTVLLGVQRTLLSTQIIVVIFFGRFGIIPYLCAVNGKTNSIMIASEIFDRLKEAANFELNENGYGYGAINRCPECKGMSEYEYSSYHYPAMCKILESLPWEHIVKYPRNPQILDEYPKEDGVYLTMMDCDEHAVCTNTFRNGAFTWMNCTHIKWWMKLPTL